MKTIQVVIEDSLLKEADMAARRQQVNRSALFREALRGYLKQMRTRELEERDRRAYLRHPDTEEDLEGWEEEIAWPGD